MPRPTLTGLSPDDRPRRGGTEIDRAGHRLRRAGDRWRPTGTELLIDGAARSDPSMISADRDPRRDAAPRPGFAHRDASSTGDARDRPRCTFEFVARADRAHGRARRGARVTGGTRIAIVGNHFRDPETTIFDRRQLPLACPCFVSADRIEGVVPAGLAPGPVSIVAYDAIGGAGTLPTSCSPTTRRPSADPPDGGVGPGELRRGRREAADQADAAGARGLGAAASPSPATRRCASDRARCAARWSRTS